MEIYLRYIFRANRELNYAHCLRDLSVWNKYKSGNICCFVVQFLKQLLHMFSNCTVYDSRQEETQCLTWLLQNFLGRFLSVWSTNDCVMTQAGVSSVAVGVDVSLNTQVDWSRMETYTSIYSKGVCMYLQVEYLQPLFTVTSASPVRLLEKSQLMLAPSNLLWPYHLPLYTSLNLGRYACTQLCLWDITAYALLQPSLCDLERHTVDTTSEQYQACSNKLNKTTIPSKIDILFCPQTLHL